MVYPNTGSILNSQIHTGLSTQISILVNNEPVGAIQSLSITQTRNLARIKEVGTDGILEIVPERATEYSANIERIVFDRLRLPEAFSRGFVNIKSQMIPFDILILDRTGGGPGSEGVVKHLLMNCWFTSYNPKYGADSFILSESATVFFEDISSTLGTSNSYVARGGERGIAQQTHERERLTDTSSGGIDGESGTGFRGTMDFSDLINAAFDE